ncbi:MAG: argininosuccinate lyase [Anaerolineales bacterium]|nr:argininosuccinate lyase [Anaerolineales bacterium]
MSVEKAYSARLSQNTAEAIQELYARPRLAGAKKFFPINLLLFKAHGVMLTETGIITRQDGAAILNTLKDFERAGFEAFPLRADLGDIYLNLQMQLMERLGERTGGWLHMAVSRNDFDLTEARIYCRELINAATRSMLTLMDSLLRVSAQHIHTVMPGYTHHSQAAQPVTLAHFLPIDRELVADLTGCDGMVENSLDAAGGRDFLMQTGSTAAIAMSTIGRLVESLLLWNTPDFGMVELADAYCGISSIMPQKKNPVGLEMIRAEVVRTHNAVNAAFGILKGLPTANGREPGYIDAEIFEATEKLILMAPFLAEILDTLTVKVENMLNKVREGFSTMTELADVIVRETDLSFHESYVLVSKLVAQVNGQGLKANAITSEWIDEIARELYQRPLQLSAEAVRQALDPVENVNTRARQGGPAPVEVARMLKKCPAAGAEHQATAAIC